MGERDLGRYQMLWDCPYCETTKLLGLTHRHCPSCGAAQDPNRRYFPNDEDKVAVEDHPFTGADRICPGCGAPSSAAASHCGACGSPLDEAKAAALRQTQQAGEAGFGADTADAAEKEHKTAKAAARAADASPPLPPKKGRLGKGCMAMGALLLGLAVICAVAMFWKKEAALQVTAQTWERSVAIEKYGPKQESAWCDSVPAGADITSRRDEKRDTKKIADGEQCTTKRVDNGDGTFTEKEDCKPKYREEPIYDEKCTYTVMKWSQTRTEQNKGAGLSPAPSWPTVRVDGCQQVGCTREGPRTETYTVVLKDPDGDDYDCTLPEAVWQKFTPGSTWTGEVGVIGDSVDCATLTAR